MAKALWIAGRAGSGGSARAPGDTHYIPATGAHNTETVEAHIQGDISHDATLRDLKTYVMTNTLSTATMTFTVRAAGSDTSMTTSYTAGQTGQKEDTSNTASVSAGDSITHKIAVAAGGTGTAVPTQISMEVETSTTVVTHLHQANNESETSYTSGTTYYLGPGGFLTPATTTEAEEQGEVNADSTLANLHAYVGTNSGTSTSVRVRVNGSDGNGVVTWTTGQTGYKEDTSNTDSLVDGDLWCWSIAPTGGNCGFYFFGCQQYGVGYQQARIGGPGTTGDFTSTAYNTLQGPFRTGGTTEAWAAVETSFDFTAAFVAAYVSANSMSGTSTIGVRKSGSTAFSVSYTTGQTGLKTATGSTAFTGETDTIDIVIAPGGTGTLSVRMVATELDIPVAHTKSLSDSVTSTDTVTKTVGLFKSDTATSTDTIAKTVGLLIPSDGVTATDGITAYGAYYFSGTWTDVAVGGLAAAAAAASIGDILVLAEGAHSFDGTLPSSVTLRGKCGESTTLTADKITMGEFCVLRDLTVTAPAASVAVIPANGNWFENVTFSECQVWEKFPAAGESATFSRCSFIETGAEDHWFTGAADFSRTGSVTWTSCYFYNSAAGSALFYLLDWTGDTSAQTMTWTNCTLINLTTRTIAQPESDMGAVVYTNNVVYAPNTTDPDFFGDADGNESGSGNYYQANHTGASLYPTIATRVDNLYLHATSFAPLSRSAAASGGSSPSGWDRNYLPLSSSAGCFQYQAPRSGLYRPWHLDPLSGFSLYYNKAPSSVTDYYTVAAGDTLSASGYGSLSANDSTFSFWFQVTNSANGDLVVDNTFYFRVASNNGTTFTLVDNDTSYVSVAGLAVGTWHHVIVTDSGTNERVYVNGSLASSVVPYQIQGNPTFGESAGTIALRIANVVYINDYLNLSTSGAQPLYAAGVSHDVEHAYKTQTGTWSGTSAPVIEWATAPSGSDVANTGSGGAHNLTFSGTPSSTSFSATYGAPPTGAIVTGKTTGVTEVLSHLTMACLIRQWVMDLMHPSVGMFATDWEGNYRLVRTAGSLTFDVVTTGASARVFGTQDIHGSSDTDA